MKIILDGSSLNLDSLWSVACEGAEVEIAPEGHERLENSRKLVHDLVSEQVPIYGFNTGVGWNKDRHIAAKAFKLYNENLIRAHTLGVGPEASEPEVRAAMVIRLNCLLCGHTGIQPIIARRYADFLNFGIHPIVPERGSVGESDIAVLSHIGLAMIGEGDVIYEGTRMTSAEAHSKAALVPIDLGPKDGLAIINSNAFGTAQGALVLCDLLGLVEQADLIYSISLEGLNGNVSPFDAKVNALRDLPGQYTSSSRVREYLEGSYLNNPDPNRPLQDPLSYRGGACVHGALRDVLEYVTKFMLIQMNTSDDNPCLMLADKQIVSCANFEVTTLALAFEMLAAALSHVSRMSCYRMIHMADPALTGLPRFLTPEETHVHAFGSLQKTFALLDTEIRHLSNPSTADFLSLAGGIEDHASNLPHVVQRIRKITDNLKYILGMEMMHAAQALTLRRNNDEDLHLGKGTQPAYYAFRKRVPWYDKDRNLSKDIASAYDVVRSGLLLQEAHKTIRT